MSNKPRFYKIVIVSICAILLLLWAWFFFVLKLGGGDDEATIIGIVGGLFRGNSYRWRAGHFIYLPLLFFTIPYFVLIFLLLKGRFQNKLYKIIKITVIFVLFVQLISCVVSAIIRWNNDYRPDTLFLFFMFLFVGAIYFLVPYVLIILLHRNNTVKKNNEDDKD